MSTERFLYIRVTYLICAMIACSAYPLSVNAAPESVVVHIHYTTSVKNKANGGFPGNISGFVTRVQEDIDRVFQNSGLDSDVAITYGSSVEMLYDEGNSPGVVQTLEDLQDKNNPLLLTGGVNVHEFRVTDGADVVILIVDADEYSDAAGGAATLGGCTDIWSPPVSCGNWPAGGDPTKAFVVLKDDAVLLDNTLGAHELCHVFGCRHQSQANEPNQGKPVPGASAWEGVSPSGTRYITAEGSQLTSGCLAQQNGCDGIPFFSKPGSVQHNGETLTTGSSGANNTNAIITTAPDVANYAEQLQAVPSQPTTDVVFFGCHQPFCAAWHFSFSSPTATKYRIQQKPSGGSWSLTAVTTNETYLAHLGQNPLTFRIRGENPFGNGSWAVFTTTGQCGGGGGGGGPIP